MDLLSEIMQTVKLRGTVYFHARFHSPWGMQIPAGQFANYHIVTEGACWVETESLNDPVHLKKVSSIILLLAASGTGKI